MKNKILVVDDEESIRWVLGKYLEKNEYSVDFAENADQALSKSLSDDYSSIILDLTLPDKSGFEILEDLKSKKVDSPVIIITAQNTVKNAIDAMKLGAYDYIAKPFDLEEVLFTVRRSVESFNNSKKLKIINSGFEDAFQNFQEMVGRSHEMLKIYKTIGRVADRDITVLITGESGTGKELVTKEIHYNSKRRSEKLVSLNIAAIPNNLLESELFGFEKGAFTGATYSKRGRFEEANRGTIHLDEIGDMPLELQTKLLRVLEEKEFYRLGGEVPIQVDIRIIASTNKSLWNEVQEGRFREDLYYRLNTVSIYIPPLRERREDIEPLTNHFLSKYLEELKVGRRILSKDALQLLYNYDWPGNIRELENIMKRVLILSSDVKITEESLLEAANHLNKKTIELNQDDETDISQVFEDGIKSLFKNLKDNGSPNLYGELIKNIEKPILKIALQLSNGNKKKASELLGINRNTLSKKLRELNIVYETKDEL